MKYLDGKRLNELVVELSSGLVREDCIDDEEFRLFLDLKALPIGFSFFGYYFISPNGEIVSTDFESDEMHREMDESQLIRILAWGAMRYTALAELIRERPPDSDDCGLCCGTKLYPTGMGANELITCVHSNGLGWLLRRED